MIESLYWIHEGGPRTHLVWERYIDRYRNPYKFWSLCGYSGRTTNRIVISVYSHPNHVRGQVCKSCLRALAAQGNEMLKIARSLDRKNQRGK